MEISILYKTRVMTIVVLMCLYHSFGMYNKKTFVKCFRLIFSHLFSVQGSWKMLSVCAFLKACEI